MIINKKTNAFTLVENLVAMSIIVIVGSLSLFSIRALRDSFESGGETQFQIAAALANARAIAAKEGRYAGVRFQREYDPRGVEYAEQYMIFIVKSDYPPNGNDKDSYEAVAGKKPIKLSNAIMVMATELGNGSVPIDDDQWIDETFELRDALTFSIIFSPSGRLVNTQVKVRNRDGIANPDNSGSSISYDDVFNSYSNVTSQDKLEQAGQFIQDNPATNRTDIVDGLEEEESVTSFLGMCHVDES